MVMLFTPKKYGKSYRLFLALAFSSVALVAALFAIVAALGWMDNVDQADRILFTLAFMAVAIGFGAVGFGQWRWFRRTPAE